MPILMVGVLKPGLQPPGIFPAASSIAGAGWLVQAHIPSMYWIIVVQAEKLRIPIIFSAL